jgi:hypothetical protein
LGATRANRAGALAISIGLVVAACGGEASAEVSAFCDDYLNVQNLVGTGPDEADPMPWVDEVTQGLEDLQTGAPSEISSAVTGMAEALLEPVSALDEEGFMAATTSESYVADAAVVNQYVEDECGLQTIAVTAIDYAYDADLDGIEPGQVAFDFSNEGTEFHEMALVRIHEDTTETIDELLAMPEDEVDAKIDFIGAAFAAPGNGDTMFTDLESGRYVILCFVPTGSKTMADMETADGPPHFMNGMVKEFTITG